MPSDYHAHRPDEGRANPQTSQGGSPLATAVTVLLIVAAVVALLIWLTTF